LSRLYQERNDLQSNLDQGIPADGPSTKYPYFPGTEDSNCTKYASSKRYFPDQVNGNAYQWDEQAKAAGYEVGNYPAKGAIMVMEKGARDGFADPDNGHVAFVEKVEYQGDGSYVVWFTDNNNLDSSLPSSITVTPGENGISFIYDKPT
jgi:surface antigen